VSPSLTTVEASTLAALEPFARDASGRVAVPNEPAALYAFGSLVRACETLLLDLFRRNLLSGTVHTCLGQELCQMAVVRALADPDDAVFSNHRSHGHFLTHTGDFLGLVAEIMGRTAGVCGGTAGSQHLAARGFYATGVQAGLTAVAVGRALELRRRGRRGLTVLIIGDGTLGQGLLYESLNLAAIWSPSLLVVVEDNGIAQSTPTAPTIGGGSIALRGSAFGLPTWSLADTDADFVGRVEDVVQIVRRSSGPGFLVINTRRAGPHSGGGTESVPPCGWHRTDDPLRELGGRLTPAERQRIDDDNAAFLAAVRDEAARSPVATFRQRPVHMFTGACRHSNAATANVQTPSRQTVREALNRALHRLLASDDRALVIGQDLCDPYGGAFKVTAGLSTAFPSRVIPTPISEAAIVGSAIGLSLAGARPIVEIMFGDFLTLAVDQLLNHAVKLAGGSGHRLPLVVRTPTGGRRGYGPTHSQSLEGLISAIPGMTVVVPSHRHDPAILLERAVGDWPYPTVFFEHKALYGLTVDRATYEEVESDPRDPAADLFPILMRGSARPDVTLVTYGGMLPVVEAVADRLAAEELAVRVVALSLLAPFPQHTIAGLLAGDGEHTMLIEEAPPAYGVGAECGAVLLEHGCRGHFLRIGAPPVPIPAARSLEADVLPSESFIYERIVSRLLA